MLKKFQNSIFKRWFAVLIAPFMVIAAYGLFREAMPVENILYSVLCSILSIIFVAIPIRIWNDLRVKIVVDENGIYVKRLYSGFSAAWDEIVLFGRDRVRIYGGATWRYYINKQDDGDKKFVLCKHDLKEFKALKESIIGNARNARIENMKQS